ncbi:hypothetical protein AB0M43_37790 [Longispora sp. NPDC051575]|uniref:hypothetical protein n=1 Tax=Longispora sp. NPDC051575 TaxID=3154943 RepID=UPI003421FF50
MLVIRFPYDPAHNERLRQASGGRARWSQHLRAFIVPVTAVADPAIRSGLAGFAAEQRLTADPAARGQLSLTGVVLRADMLPTGVWGSNLRGILSRDQWAGLRIPVAEAAGGVCEICGKPSVNDEGRKVRPDCHERWSFDMRPGSVLLAVQTLTGLIALCKVCHLVQHLGFAEVQGRVAEVIEQLRAVNGWTYAEARVDLDRARREFDYRSAFSWDLDLTVLRGRIAVPTAPDLYVAAGRRAQLGNSFQPRPTVRAALRPVGQPAPV